MVDEYLNLNAPLTTRRADRAEELVDVWENRGARKGSGEIGVKLGEKVRQETTSSPGQGVPRDDTDGVGAAADSCKDDDIESDDKGDDGQM